MARKSDKGTYVYGIVAAPRRPTLPRRARGLSGAGPVRLLSFDESVSGRKGMRSWVIVADVPLSRYGADGINERLNDLDWVARAAMGHESVIESFLKAPAVLPMKLFTIFKTDDRALEDLGSRRPQITSTLERVAEQEEWGVRIVLKGAPVARTSRRRAGAADGASYLERKRHQRRAAVELVTRAREVGGEVFDRLASVANQSHRRAAGELPASNGALLVDAVFLVPRSRSKKFQTTAGREAARLAPDGYELTLTGPWPAYSFMNE